MKKNLLPSLFFFSFIVILTSLPSYGSPCFLKLNINVTPISSENSNLKEGENKTTHIITIDPLQKETTRASLNLCQGEDLIIEVANPNQTFINGNIEHNMSESHDSISYSNNITNYNGWENFFLGSSPIKLVESRNGDPISFHFRAVHPGSLVLKVEHGDDFDAVCYALAIF